MHAQGSTPAEAASAITDEESMELVGYRQTAEQKLEMVALVAAKLTAAAEAALDGVTSWAEDPECKCDKCGKPIEMWGEARDGSKFCESCTFAEPMPEV